MKSPPRTEMMRIIQSKLDARGYLGAKDIKAVAGRLRLPVSSVFGFAGQFPEFPLRPYRARVRVCVGPACAGAGAWDLYDDLKRMAPSGVEVFADIGVLRPHRSPAVWVEAPGAGAGILEGLDPADAAGLAARLPGEGGLSGIPLTRGSPPMVEALSGQEPAPCAEAQPGGELPASWGPRLVRWARDHSHEILHTAFADMSRKDDRIDGPRTAETLVCDTVGGEPENSADFVASIIHPRAVVAGAAMAAAACGARRLLFYVPWNDAAPGETLERAAAELLAGTGVRHSVLRGPVHISCSRELGVMAVVNGMMLWRAASLHGRRGALDGDSSLALIAADAARRLPWMAGENGACREAWSRGRLVCLTAPDMDPRLLEVPARAEFDDALAAVAASRDDIKAVYAGKTVARKAPHGGKEIPMTAGEVVLFGARVCMPRLALYLARRAEGACCGGCVPGRTVPAVAARLARGVVEGEGGEETLERLSSVLAGTGELALCPRLEEVSRPIRDCMREFEDEFEAHAREGECGSSPCPPAPEP